MEAWDEGLVEAGGGFACRNLITQDRIICRRLSTNGMVRALRDTIKFIQTLVLICATWRVRAVPLADGGDILESNLQSEDLTQHPHTLLS